MDCDECERELIERLQELPLFIARGLTVELHAAGLIIIALAGGVRGIWLMRPDGLAYVPGGYNEPTHFASNVGEAVDMTCELFDMR